MTKDTIRLKLREGYKEIIPEFVVQPAANQNPSNGAPSKPHGRKKAYRKEYNDIQTALDDTMLKKSQVMGAAGLGDPDDAGDRRAFNAKLDREENEEGSIRQFNDKELAAVAKVVSNPKSYLNKKT